MCLLLCDWCVCGVCVVLSLSCDAGVAVVWCVCCPLCVVGHLMRAVVVGCCVLSRGVWWRVLLVVCCLVLCALLFVVR